MPLDISKIGCEADKYPKDGQTRTPADVKNHIIIFNYLLLSASIKTYIKFCGGRYEWGKLVIIQKDKEKNPPTFTS